ncbi:MAG: hypothetical protein Q4B40_05840 [Clostridia bacterium]|nr:hypothetical protein [Clostridia bacterium]
MNGINAFITSFCVSCIVLGLLFILVPKGALNKSVKYIFSLCFVCCLISSVVALPKLDFSDFDVVRNREMVTEQNAQMTAKAVFGEALKSQNINFKKITVDTNKPSDSSIIISKVTVFTDHDAEKIVDVIGSTEYEVVVINE